MNEFSYLTIYLLTAPLLVIISKIAVEYIHITDCPERLEKMASAKQMKDEPL